MMDFENIINNLKDSLSPKKVIFLTGNQDLDISSVISVAVYGTKVKFLLTKKKKDLIEKIRNEMMLQVASGIPMYGATTSYGGRAGVVLNKGDEKKKIENATKLSESIIHVDVSTGTPICREIVRSAMIIRINMLLKGVSAVRLETLEDLLKLVNENVTPVVGQYGSLGASGDLAQNGRVLSALLQTRGVKVWDQKGNIFEASKLLNKFGIKPLKLYPKEGLALVNGDNFSSASCLYVLYETLSLLIVNLFVNALTIQVLKGSERNFHPFLAEIRPHEGQKIVSEILRNLIHGSKLARQDLRGHEQRMNGELVQDPYSIRCLPQYYAPEIENLISIWKTLTININSVSDNPLWIPPESVVSGEKPYQWISGGNFMAMHMSDSLDKLRKILVHLIKLDDRHLSRMVHPAFSNGLPPNLSDKKSISQSAFKGLQTQMGMLEVYSSLLLHPASTAFGTHEEFNQDITSHAPSSSILSWELIKVARLAVASNLIASCQAVDLRGGIDFLSTPTRPIYTWLRKMVPYIKKEQPLGNYIEVVSEKITGPILMKILIKNLKYGKL